MALTQLNSETITVQTSAVGLTSTLLVGSNGNTLGVIVTKWQHRSGGKVFGLARQAPVAGGGNGDEEFVAGDEWDVAGFNDIRDFKLIKQTGEADATVDIQTYGTP